MSQLKVLCLINDRGDDSGLESYRKNLTASANVRQGVSITFFDTSTSVPTTDALVQYDSILVYSYGVSAGYQDAVATGNNLAAAVEKGKGIVIFAVHALEKNSRFGELKGRIAEEDFLPIEKAESVRGYRWTLGERAIPRHPIISSVDKYNGGKNSFHLATKLTTGATLIASYDNGVPFVAEKARLGGYGIVVCLNMWAISDKGRIDGWDSSTNGALIVANAIEYVSLRDCLPRAIAGIEAISHQDKQVIRAAASQVIEGTFEDVKLQEGEPTDVELTGECEVIYPNGMSVIRHLEKGKAHRMKCTQKTSINSTGDVMIVEIDIYILADDMLPILPSGDLTLFEKDWKGERQLKSNCKNTIRVRTEVRAKKESALTRCIGPICEGVFGKGWLGYTGYNRCLTGDGYVDLMDMKGCCQRVNLQGETIYEAICAFQKGETRFNTPIWFYGQDWRIVTRVYNSATTTFALCGSSYSSSYSYAEYCSSVRDMVGSRMYEYYYGSGGGGWACGFGSRSSGWACGFGSGGGGRGGGGGGGGGRSGGGDGGGGGGGGGGSGWYYGLDNSIRCMFGPGATRIGGAVPKRVRGKVMVYKQHSLHVAIDLNDEEVYEADIAIPDSVKKVIVIVRVHFLKRDYNPIRVISTKQTYAVNEDGTTEELAITENYNQLFDQDFNCECPKCGKKEALKSMIRCKLCDLSYCPCPSNMLACGICNNFICLPCIAPGGLKCAICQTLACHNCNIGGKIPKCKKCNSHCCPKGHASCDVCKATYCNSCQDIPRTKCESCGKSTICPTCLQHCDFCKKHNCAGCAKFRQCGACPLLGCEKCSSDKYILCGTCLLHLCPSCRICCPKCKQRVDPEQFIVNEEKTNQLAALVNPEPPSLPQPPKLGGRAFFSGLIVGDHSEGSYSEIYKEDGYSECVGAGAYPDNKTAFPKAVASTFDGIAIDKYTRVILYEAPNFQGQVLLDKTGPAIIINTRWRNTPDYAKTLTDTYKEPLQTSYPNKVREWSGSDMHQWINGSVKVISI